MKRIVLAVTSLAAFSGPALAQREFGFDNRKASGQPYLKPEESVQRMKAADGFEVKLFAAEPMVVNPIAMTVDEKGRVWVIESFEYPKRTPKGKKPRDRIVILEDTDGDGVADKRTVFAEGKDFPESFDLASGLEVGHGGVFVGAPPGLWFIENKNDKPGKFTKLLGGFGSEDTHEMLNTLQWGPDGRLYGLHGVFTNSTVKSGEPQTSAPGVKMNAAVWRYDVQNKKFEIFAEGTSNPWGMDWRNTDGEFILCCCVIPHLFHISPGGIYKRQAGQSFNQYAYGYLNEICDHTFHKKSGWAHAGLISLDTEIMPKEYRDSVIFGSIHGCSIKRNKLKPNGSTFIASEADDFLVSGDKNFRPINLRWGHNGEIYCIDWHDQHPCHQTNPDDWDYEHGRVYRIQPKGMKTKKAEDLGTKSILELVRLVHKDNPYIRRTALRLLSAARPRATGFFDVESAQSSIPDFLAASCFNQLLEFHKSPFVSDEVRALSVRMASERELSTPRDLESVKSLAIMAQKAKAPKVRRELASAAIRFGPIPVNLGLIHALLERDEDAKDPVIPQLIWLAYEPFLPPNAKSELAWLNEKTVGNPLVSDFIVPRAMRRLIATNKAEHLEVCIAFVGDLKDAAARRQALEGLAEALKNQLVDAPPSWKSVMAKLREDKDARVQDLTNRLAVSFRDPVAVARALKIAGDASLAVAERLSAIRDLALARPPQAQEVLREVLFRESNDALRQEACRALAAYDSPDLADAVIAGWKRFPPPVRTEAVNLLAGRKGWAKDLLAAVGKGTVARTELTNNTILRIRSFKDMDLNEQIEKVWGKFRDTPAELNALIDKMRIELDKGPASFARGKVVFDNNCAKCHKFDGRGHEVGPALDGAGRDIEYLLANILDPNRVVGQPYYVRTVELKDGRIESGLLHAEDDNSITLKVENAVLKTIQKKDIEGKIVVQSKSVMPEGLDKNMSVQDFRDLVHYTMLHPFLTNVQFFAPGDATKPTRPLVGVSGRINLPPIEKEGTALAAVVATEVIAPEAMRTQLLIGSANRIRVSLNGKTVYSGQPGTGPARPDQARADVELKKGSNLIVFTVLYVGANEAIYARLLDPERRLRELEAEKK